MTTHNTSSLDTYFMKEALILAKKAMGWTNPHPMVGAVVVKNGKIIARGYHRRFGADHAEMDALKHAEEDVKDASMYVTLEPCHLPYDLFGKRTPCVDVIKQAGIKKVYIAMLDSNPEVSGRGKTVLQESGVKTILGLLQKEALSLNETYHHFMQKGRPFVAITFSVSLDGKIATRIGDSKWITNEKARIFARKLRGQYQAILVGINTVIKDNPHLGVRISGEKDPMRIIVDSNLKIPLNSQIFRDNNVLIATTTKAPKEKQKQLIKQGVETLAFENETIPLKKLLFSLRKKRIISVLVEGGGKILGSFVDEKLVNKVYAFHAPLLIGGKNAVTAIAGNGAKTLKDAIKLKDTTFNKFGDNLLITGYV